MLAIFAERRAKKFTGKLVAAQMKPGVTNAASKSINTQIVDFPGRCPIGLIFIARLPGTHFSTVLF
jgi:hypothetical protein